MMSVGQNLNLLEALCNTFPVDDVSAEMPQGYRHANFPSDNFSNNHFFSFLVPAMQENKAAACIAQSVGSCFECQFVQHFQGIKTLGFTN